MQVSIPIACTKNRNMIQWDYLVQNDGSESWKNKTDMSGKNQKQGILQYCNIFWFPKNNVYINQLLKATQWLINIFMPKTLQKISLRRRALRPALSCVVVNQAIYNKVNHWPHRKKYERCCYRFHNLSGVAIDLISVAERSTAVARQCAQSPHSNQNVVCHRNVC